jgi:hypothetical protein
MADQADPYSAILNVSHYREKIFSLYSFITIINGSTSHGITVGQ